jgi:phosphoesterase RecJ-like protein
MRSFPLLKLWGLALSKLNIDLKRGLAWVFVSNEDFQETGASYRDLEGLVILLHGIPGVKITVLLSERENGVVKGSIRTIDGIDASYYAGAFGGGGHHKAAGFSARLLLDHTIDHAHTLATHAA